jgi:hypothetical protein
MNLRCHSSTRRHRPRRGSCLALCAGSLLLSVCLAPYARAVTTVSVDGRTAPVTLTVGETVTIRFDTAKASGSVQYRWSRDLTGKYDPASPIALTNPITDGGSEDADPAPGKIAWNFTVPPLMPAGRYLLRLEDRVDGTALDAPFWTVVPKPQAQSLSGRVVLGSGSTAPGSPPPDAIIWAYADLNGLPVASANVGADGGYTLPLPPGRYMVFSEWFGNLRSQRQAVTVAAGQQIAGVNHTLLVGQEVSGSLRDDAGKPLPNAAVTATPNQGTALTTQSFADGSYVLVLPEGQWRIGARGMEKVVTVADQPQDGVDFPPPPTGPTPATGTILTIAGNGVSGLGGDGGPAATARLQNVVGLSIDRAGNLYLVDNVVNRVRKIDAATGIITTVAGSARVDAIRFLAPFGSTGGFSGDGGPATTARLDTPQHLAVDGAGNLYISDGSNQRVRRVDAKTGIITTVAGSGPAGSANGSFSGDGGPATAATLFRPQGIAVDGAGNLYIADRDNHRVRKVSPDGVITTVAGGGKNPLTEGADAVSVALNTPRNVAVDGQGNLFVWDNSLNRVLKMTPDGKLRFYAGNGTAGFSGDGGLATAAQLNATYLSMAVDSAGSLFMVDMANNRIRKVSPEGIISTVAGSGATGVGSGGFSGDGSPATSARLNLPASVAIDAAGNLYIAEILNKRIRKVIGVAAPGLLAPGG